MTAVNPPPPVPTAAALLFGARAPAAVAYVDRLRTAAVERGLIGPREALRLWDRHILNCAVVAELIPANARVIDVGSGAGLPGIVLALARPDLDIVLLEPMGRRATFLTESVQVLGLERVVVRRARAEDLRLRAGANDCDALEPAPIVTARAVAPLDRLVAWCLPLVATGGRLLAIKGRSAEAELAANRSAIRRAGGTSARIRVCGIGTVEPPTTVVEIMRGSTQASRTSLR